MAGRIDDFLKSYDTKGVEPDPLQSAPPPESKEGVGIRSWLSNDHKARNLKAAIARGQDIDVPQSFRILDVAAKTGLPKDFVQRNLEDLEKKSKEVDFNPSNFIRTSPKLAEWMSEHPSHAAAIREDLYGMSYFERMMGDVSQGFEIGKAQTEISDIGWSGLMGEWTTAQTDRLNELQKKLEARMDFGLEGFFEGVPGAMSEQVPIMGKLIEGQAIGAVAGGAGGAVAGLVAGGAGAIPGATTGAIIGWRAGALLAAAKLEAGLAFAEFVNLTDENGQKLDIDTARGAAAIAGAVNGVFEGVIGLRSITRTIPGLRALSRGGIRKMLGTPSLRRAFTHYAKNVGIAMAGEGATEYFQELVTSVSGDVATGLQDGSLAQKSTSQILNEFVRDQEKQARFIEAGKAGAQAGLGFAFGGTTADVVGEVSKIRSARKKQRVVSEIVNGAKNSKMAKELPAAARQLIKRITEGKVEKVYTPIEAWNEYWQGVGVDPVEAAEQYTGDPDAYLEAARTGEDLQIPTERFVTEIAANEEHSEYFDMNSRLSPTDETRAESDRHTQELDARIEAEQQGAQEKVDGRERILSEIQGQLQGVGFSEQDAKDQAVLYSEAFGTMAEKAGIDPVSLFERYGIQITREGMKSLPESVTDSLDVIIDQLRSGEVPKDVDAYGKPLVEFLKEKGGISPEGLGGDIAALEPDRGRKPFEKNLVQQGGLDIDAATQAAYESGYIGSGDINELIQAVGRELGGKQVFSAQNRNNEIADRLEGINQIGRYLKDLGVNLDEMDNEQVKKVIESGMPVKAEPEEIFLQSGEDLGLMAKNHFGSTEDIREAGYILPDGTMLDLSGRHEAADRFKSDFDGQRYVDHRQLPQEVWEALGKNDSPTSTMFEFQKKAKAIRVAPGYAISANFIPTRQQLNKLVSRWNREYSDGMEVEVDHPRHGGTITSVQVDRVTTDGLLSIFEKNLTDLSLEQEARGRIKFLKDGKFNIELMKQADLSTFLHESGHFFLEVLGDIAQMRDSDQSVKDDYKTLLEWFGLESRDQIKTEHHEQFARGFEAYLREGRAPSTKLERAFARFRRWLVNIYRSIKKLDVDLTDDVREVFDRMLATDKEISEVRQQEKMYGLFKDASEFTENEQKAREYFNIGQEAKDKASSDLVMKVLKPLQRQKMKWWKEQRKKVQDGLEEELNTRPVYRALSVLQKGKAPDGSELPQNLQGLKLNRKQIVDLFGAEFAKSKLPRGVYAREGGIDINAAATLFGFPSGEEMLIALSNSVKKSEMLKNLTDQEMLKRYGDPMFDGSLQEEARKIVYSQKESQRMRKELEILASEEFATFKGAAKKISRPIPMIQTVREQARIAVSKRKVRDIKPSIYLAARRKAFSEAMDLFLKGDFEGAFEAKLRELYSHERYRAAVEAVEEIEKTVNFAKKFSKKSIRKRLAKVGGDYLEQIDSILTRYDFRKSISLKAIDKKKSLKEFVDEQRSHGYRVHVPDKLLNEAYRTHYKDVTLEELMGVKDTVSVIDHLARTKDKMMDAQLKRKLSNIENEIAISIGHFHNLDAKLEDFTAGIRQTVKTNVKVGIAKHTRMEFLFEFLDGNKAAGIVWQYLFKPFVNAEKSKNQMVEKSVKDMEEILDAYTKKERVMFNYKKVHIPGALTQKMKQLGRAPNFTKANLLSVALNVGNEYNKEGLLKGYGWSDAQLEEILSHLDKRDWDTVQKIWDYIDSYWPEIVKLEKEINGTPPKKVEATPVKTKFGTYKGGYYPINFDGKISLRQMARDKEAQVKKIFGGDWVHPQTEQGQLVARTNTGGHPFILELSTFTNHITDVIHDLAYRRAIIDVDRIINTEGVRSSISRAAGTEMYNQLRPWLLNMAGNDRGNYDSHYERLWGHVRAGATIVNMGLKFTTALVQPLGYTVSIKELGSEYSLKGLASVFKDPLEFKNVLKFAQDRSDLMKNRLSTYDRDIRDFGKRISIAGTKPGVLGIVDSYTHQRTNAWFQFIGMMDMAVSLPTWMGAYQKAMDGKVENIKGGDEQAAIDFADRTVRVTQGSGAAKDLAAIQRGHELWRLFTMFYSYFSVLGNQFQKTYNQFKMDRDLSALINSTMWLWFIPASMEALILGKGPKDDDEWLKWFLRRNAAYPANTIIGVRDIANAWDWSLTSGRLSYDASPAFDAGFATVGALVAASKAVSGEELTRYDFKNIFMTGAYATQLPGRQVWLTSEYFYDWLISGKQDPESVAEGLWRGLVIGKEHKK